MNVALWVIQSLLAGVFLFSGLTKSTYSKQRLIAAGATGVSHYSLEFIRFIAASEIAGAVGLVLPWLVGVARFLTPAAAASLAIIMSGAAASHALLASNNPREWRNVIANFVLIALLIAVTIGRA